MLEDKLMFKDGVIKYIDNGQEVDVTDYVSSLVTKKEQEAQLKISKRMDDRNELMFFIPISNEVCDELKGKSVFHLHKFAKQFTEDKGVYCAGPIKAKLFKELSDKAVGVQQVVNGEYDLVESWVLDKDQESALRDKLSDTIVNHIKEEGPFIRVVWR